MAPTPSRPLWDGGPCVSRGSLSAARRRATRFDELTQRLLELQTAVGIAVRDLREMQEELRMVGAASDDGSATESSTRGAPVTLSASTRCAAIANAGFATADARSAAYRSLVGASPEPTSSYRPPTLETMLTVEEMIRGRRVLHLAWSTAADSPGR